LLSGLIPALRITRMDPQEVLKAATHNSTGTRQDLRLREIMVGIEVALSAMLLVCAGLLVTSLQRVLHVDRGFGAQHAVTFGIQLPSHFREKPERVKVFDRLLDTLSAIPGVDSVGSVAGLPLMGESSVNPITLEGAKSAVLDPLSKETLFINGRDSSPGYFRAMGIALLKGRIFEPRDRGRSVAVVSARLADNLWPNQSPLGKRFNAGFGLGTLEVVGVVQDVHNTKLEKAPTHIVYFPYWLRGRGYGDIVVRTSLDPQSLMPEIRRRVRSIDPALPVAQMRTLDRLVSDATADRRFQMQIVVGFASAALLLALVGIYGVVAYSAAQRRFEMGLRAALGARPRDILGLMATAGMRPIAWGLLAGLAGAIACGRLLRGLLFGVTPLDAVTLVSVTLLLGTAGAVACWLPGRAVARVDPATVLRYE
jgi:putative ABC transport system permease protein